MLDAGARCLHKAPDNWFIGLSVSGSGPTGGAGLTLGSDAAEPRLSDGVPMFLILLDEPGLFVYEDPGDAAADIESIDIEESLRAAFDDRGVPYRVDWPQGPPRRSPRILGLQVVSNVAYGFVPAGPADVPALTRLLDQHSEYVVPKDAIDRVHSLRSRLHVAP